MTPILKSAPLGGKHHFSSSRPTSVLSKAVSLALWRQPRTSRLYVGQSFASAATPALAPGIGASLRSLAGGDWLSLVLDRRAVKSGSTPWREKQHNSSKLSAATT